MARWSCFTKSYWLVLFLCLWMGLFLTWSTHAALTYLAFPKNFKWCVSTAAHQIEGHNYQSDWWDWENIPGHIRDGTTSEIACDHWNRVSQDTLLMKELHIQQYRFSVEWAKIEPTEGIWDESAIQHYQMEVETLRTHGIEPMITLQHFTLPRWLRAKGGWEWTGAAAAFARFAERVYQTIGSGVHDWITINEPMVHLVGGYFAGLTPPGKNDLRLAIPAIEGLLRAHAAAYHALHEAAQKNDNAFIRVGISHHLRIFDPDSIFNPLHAMAAQTLDTIFNWMFGEAVETGRFKMNIPFIINIDKKIDGLKGTQDFIGINYYTRDMVYFSLNGLMGIELLVNEQSPISDLGWEIYPEGLYRLLKAAVQHFPGKSILITENGVADQNDVKRKKFIETHLSALHRAILDGVPVESYCHWSLMDNFEWLEGESARFGLYKTDYKTLERIPRESAKYYSQIAQENGLWAEPFRTTHKMRVGGWLRRQQYSRY